MNPTLQPLESTGASGSILLRDKKDTKAPVKIGCGCTGNGRASSLPQGLGVFLCFPCSHLLPWDVYVALCPSFQLPRLKPTLSLSD